MNNAVASAPVCQEQFDKTNSMSPTTDGYLQYSALRRFGSLDGLRAIAIAGVLWRHCTQVTSDAEPFTNAGASGVSLFFVLSGFLITTLLLREWRATGRIELSAFYWRRSLRIFPLYYATLAVYCAFVAIIEPNSAAGRDFFANLPYYATYTNNWFVDLRVNADGEMRTIFVFAWTLATEEQFYLMWPPLLFLLGARRAFWLLAGMIAFDLALSATIPMGFGGFNGFNTGSPATVADRLVRIATSFSSEIAIGCVLGGMLHYRRTFEFVWRVLGRSWSIWVAAAASIAVVIAWSEVTLWWRLTQSVAFAALIGAAVIQPRQGLSWLLDNRVLVRIGVVSYGMYLLHMIGIHLVTRSAAAAGWNLLDAPWLRLGLASAATFILSDLSFRWFEAPILALKTRTPWFGLGRRWREAKRL